MNELPIITVDDLKACAKGECNQCGRCCIAFAVDVPGELGDGFSYRYNKVMGERCPQLITTEDGRHLCGVHDQKDSAPLLETCRIWEGGYGYHMMLKNIRLMTTAPETKQQAERSIDWMNQGLLADVDLTIQNSGDLLCIIENYLDLLGFIPHEFFAYVHLREAIADHCKNKDSFFMQKYVNRIKDGTNVTQLEKEFFTQYIEPALSAQSHQE